MNISIIWCKLFWGITLHVLPTFQKIIVRKIRIEVEGSIDLVQFEKNRLKIIFLQYKSMYFYLFYYYYLFISKNSEKNVKNQMVFTAALLPPQWWLVFIYYHVINHVFIYHVTCLWGYSIPRKPGICFLAAVYVDGNKKMKINVFR